MNEHANWDSTVWDPEDPEQVATEDGMHGPSAVHEMLQIPAMPLGNGMYYQPGGAYVWGTVYVDSRGMPVYAEGAPEGTARLRESLDLQEWVEAYRQSEKALIRLEARRQQARLQATGFAHCYRPSDVCPGGKQLEVCETGGPAHNATQKWARDNNEERPGQGVVSNILTWAGGRCVECSVLCRAAVNTQDGRPQETEVSFYRPDPDTPFQPL